MASNKDIVQWAYQVIMQNLYQVAQILGLNPVKVRVSVGNLSGGTVAETTGYQITLDKKHFASMDDPGGVIHEYVHAVQNIQGGNVPPDVKEAVADYVRWKLGLTYAGWEPSPMVKQLGQLSPEQVQAIARETAQGKWRNSWLRNPATIPNLPAITVPFNSDGTPVIWANDPSGSSGGGIGGTVGGTATTSNTNPGWNYIGPLGDPNAILDPKNWVWQGPGQPTSPNPATLMQGGQQQNTAAANRNARAAFENILIGWGIPLDAGLQGLIQQGIKAGWNTARFLNALYQTDEFKQAFPGIFNPDGTLKMSPSQYLATKRSYQAYAQQFGVNLNDSQVSYLFRNNVSPQEFAIRAQALTTLRTNQQYFQAFNQQLRQEGMQPLSKADQFRFVMGEGNQEWYDLWQRASTRYAAEQAGLHFGKVGQAYTNIPQGVVKKVAGLGLDTSQMQKGFAQLAQELQRTLPMSRIQKFGLSKEDLVQLEFGGPRQAAVAQKVQQIMANEQAFLQNRVRGEFLTPGLATRGQGVQQVAAQGP
jgi:uncharacterized protein YfkK (UPF0435 family)